MSGIVEFHGISSRAKQLKYRGGGMNSGTNRNFTDAKGYFGMKGAQRQGVDICG